MWRKKNKIDAIVDAISDKIGRYRSVMTVAKEMIIVW